MWKNEHRYSVVDKRRQEAIDAQKKRNLLDAKRQHLYCQVHSRRWLPIRLPPQLLKEQYFIRIESLCSLADRHGITPHDRAMARRAIALLEDTFLP